MKEVGEEEGGKQLMKTNIDKSALYVGHFTRELKKSEVEICHKGLRHVSSSVLTKLFSVNGQHMCKVTECIVSPYAKQTRIAFPMSSIKSITSFKLIHVDLWGLYSTSTFDNKKYFFPIVDDHSRITWLGINQICISSIIS